MGELRRFRPQVLHAFLYHSYVLAAPAARLARVPVVVAGRRNLHELANCRLPGRIAERLATALTDQVIANAHAVAEEILRKGRAPASKVAVVHNGLPASAFVTQQPAPLASAHRVVLCVASLRSCKGHRTLLSAAALLGSTPKPTEAQVRAALDGNLCRCGSYNRAVRAVLRAAQAT